MRTTKRNRRRRHCTRFVGVDSFARANAVGAARFRFTGRLRGRKLQPASYRMQAIPRNGAGKGPVVYQHFRIKR